MMIWLSLSFILLYILLGDDLILRALGETQPGNSIWLLIRSAVCGAIGAILTIWGFTGKPTAFVHAVKPVGKTLCPNCGAELLPTTSICPYCGMDLSRLK